MSNNPFCLPFPPSSSSQPTTLLEMLFYAQLPEEYDYIEEDYYEEYSDSTFINTLNPDELDEPDGDDWQAEGVWVHYHPF